MAQEDNPRPSCGTSPHNADFLRRILDAIGHPLYVVDVRDYRLCFANAATPLKEGADGDSATCYRLTHRRDTPCEGDPPCPLREAVRTRAPAVVEHTHFDDQGDPAPVEVHGQPIFDDDGEITHLVEYTLDMSLRQKIEADLRQTSQVFRHSGEGALITDRTGRIQRVNRAFTRITGYEEAEAAGKTPGELLSSGWQDREFYRQMWQAIDRDGLWQGEIWNRRKGGEAYPEWLTVSSVTDEAGEVQAYIGIFSDITRKKQEESELRRLAYYDPLTRLPNRATLVDRLDQALARSVRQGTELALLFVDLDGFKEINDQWGHQAGDEALREVGSRLSGLVRRTDTIARLGGDEFTVLLEGTGPGRAELVAEKIITALNEPISVGDGNSVRLGCSVGIAGCCGGEPPQAHGEALLEYADRAMYQAKASGKNTYRIFTGAAAEAPAGDTASLEQALQRRELELYFQPEVELATSRLAALEALLRWNHSEQGLLEPERFFTQIRPGVDDHQLSEWVLHTACSRVQDWHRAGKGPISVAVNLFGSDFQQPAALVGSVQRVLDRTGLDPQWLALEIPEQVLTHDPDLARKTLEKLSDLGVRLTIDDFGEGDSSLRSLHIVGIDKLKLSRHFVARALAASRKDMEARLLDSIHGIAMDLGLVVVAKGVETRQQWETLRQRGHCCAQGFFLGRPRPAADFPLVEGWWHTHHDQPGLRPH